MLVAAALLALAALRAAVPGRRVGAAISLAAATALALGSLLVLSKPVFTSWTPDVFLAVGLPCLWRSFAWTMVPWALLVIAVRRAAPLRSRWTGALVGAAAWVPDVRGAQAVLSDGRADASRRLPRAAVRDRHGPVGGAGSHALSRSPRVTIAGPAPYSPWGTYGSGHRPGKRRASSPTAHPRADPPARPAAQRVAS